MKKTIHKHTLDDMPLQIISLPVGAKIISAINQHEEIVIYYLFDIETTMREDRRIEIWGTGHEIGYDSTTKREFIGTVSMNNARLVFHIFELITL